MCKLCIYYMREVDEEDRERESERDYNEDESGVVRNLLLGMRVRVGGVLARDWERWASVVEGGRIVEKLL